MRARLLLGLALIVLGALFLLDAADLLNAGAVLARWWPLAIVALGVSQVLARPMGLAGPVVMIAIGLLLLGGTLGLATATLMAVVGPAVLVAVGIWLLLSRPGAAPAGGDGEDVVRAVSVFSGRELASRSRTFRGGALTALFGGIELDLRRAMPVEDGATIDVTAAFGGVDIVVPPGWRVSLGGPALFGGYEHKQAPGAAPGEDAPRLTVRMLVLFAGASVTEDAALPAPPRPTGVAAGR